MTLRSVDLVAACALAGLGGFSPAYAQGGSPKPAPAAARSQPAPAADAKQEARASAIRLGSAAKPKTPGTIRVATYNLENLFDHVDDPNLKGSIEDMELAITPERGRALAATILATQADIVACEEVESLEALTWFRDTYLTGQGFDHVASIQSGDARGIEQGILSKVPFKSAELAIPVDQLKLEGVHPASLPKSDAGKVGKPIVMSRSPLKVEFVIPAAKVAELNEEAAAAEAAAEKAAKGKKGAKAKKAGAKPAADYAFTMYVLHHKSAREYAHQREAEAKRVLGLVKELEKQNPSANVLLAGDFNSLPQHEGPQVYFSGGLIDLFGDRQRGDMTMMTHATNRAIDYLVVNENMRPEVVMESRFIFGTPLRARDADWNTTPPPEGYASDHLPVVVDIRPVD